MTDLMNRILDTAGSTGPDWLQERQASGRKLWAAAQLPSRKTEAWKYTSLSALNQDFTSGEPSAASKAELGFEYPYFGGCQGQPLNAFSPSVTPDGNVTDVRPEQ